MNELFFSAREKIEAWQIETGKLINSFKTRGRAKSPNGNSSTSEITNMEQKYSLFDLFM